MRTRWVRTNAARTRGSKRAASEKGGRVGGGGRNKLHPRGPAVSADAPIYPRGNFITDATVCPSHERPNGHRLTVRSSIRSSSIVRVTTLLQDGYGLGNSYNLLNHDWVLGNLHGVCNEISHIWLLLDHPNLAKWSGHCSLIGANFQAPHLTVGFLCMSWFVQIFFNLVAN
jgi:hypothetical protein